MADLSAGTTVYDLDTTPTVENFQSGSYTFTNTSYGVSTASGTYADCGVAFLAPTTGRVMIYIVARLSGTGQTFIAPVIRDGSTVGSGTSRVAASDSRAMETASSTAMRFGTVTQVTAGTLTPGSTYNVRLEHRVVSGTGTASSRLVVVTCLP